jgi:membrane-bound lytic murein transglycosylase D
LFYPKIKTMLKTQISKAFYLCLFYFVASSFAPAAHYTVAISDKSADEEMPAPAATAAKMVYAAPKAKLNRQALQFAARFIKNSEEELASARQRSKTPFTIMDAVFTRYGLPVELKYLAVIESQLKTTALSHVGALGPWQLMPETAHDLGLKITRQYDERTSYSKSTKAAALYLRDLYSRFGDWLLVLAAYNAGPRPVYAAIRKSGSRNFWALQSYLPAETRGHVKRFIATEYYFEGHGSVATLTKAENAEYRKSVNAFALAHAGTGLAGVGVLTTGFSFAGFSIPGIGKESNLSILSFDAREKTVEGTEPKEQLFKRLMKESEKSLQKSNKVIQG